MSFLYISEQNYTLSVDGGYCMVKTKGGMLRKIPIETLEYVSLFGDIHITVPAIKTFMTNKIPVTLYSKTGGYFGRIMSNENVNITRQRKQFKLSGDTEFSLNLAKRIIAAKVHNQVVILNRYMPKNDETGAVRDSIQQMKIISKDIEKADNIIKLMGCEGIIARYYFHALSKCVVREFQFNGRSRRPPKDEFNSMLSLGYSMLMNEVYGAVEGKGLNVYAGFLHQDRERHPTVASDLMEEWRAVIVDSTVMSLVNGHEVKKEGFRREENGVFLENDTFKIFVKKYENKMRTDTNYLNYTDSRMSFRQAVWYQAAALAKAIDEENYELYNPILIR